MEVLSFVDGARRIGRNPAPHSQRPLAVPAADRDRLLGWIRDAATPRRLVVRSVVVLLAGIGWTNSQIAAQLGISRRTVALWKTRYLAGGASAVVSDAPGRGRKPGRNSVAVARILAATRQLPPDGVRWTVRSLARSVGVSYATVQRVWREHGGPSAIGRA